MDDTAHRLAESATAAALRIADIVRKTPLDPSARLTALTGRDVRLKRENRQHTGSFKLRGAANRLMTLDDDTRARGCVAASSGNHGAAVAYAMRALDVGGVIFVPEKTSSAKVDGIRAHGGDVRFFGTDGLDTELHARAYADAHGMCYLSPYNDPEVVAGQATTGIEIVEQFPDVDTVYVAVGGGGLISGIASVVKRHRPGARIVGCQPLNSPVMARSIEAGCIVDIESRPTLSDGTAGGIEPGAITFDWCRSLVDEFVLVDEDEIAAAMRRYIEDESETIEGAAGVALAALEKKCNEPGGDNVTIIICGGNISRDTLQTVTSTG